VGHGQMRERDLEQLMVDFYHRRFDILLCTTIIESGIDVPTANTIMINRADKLGLIESSGHGWRIGLRLLAIFVVVLGIFASTFMWSLRPTLVAVPWTNVPVTLAFPMVVVFDPFPDDKGCICNGPFIQINMDARLSESFSKIFRQGGTAGQIFMGHDQGAVGINDVLLRPLSVFSERHFLKVILLGKRPILSLPALGNPSAIGDVVLNGKIESGPVCAGLSAGDDSGDHVNSPIIS